MIEGNIIDVYPDYRNNVMVTWLIGKGKVRKIVDKYEPSFHIYSDKKELYQIAEMLHGFPQLKQLNFTYEKINLGSENKKLVLEVIPKTLKSLRKMAHMVDAWGGFHKYQLFNVDVRLSGRYLQQEGVFCNAWVKWDGKRFSSVEGQWDIDYNLPDFKVVKFDVKQEQMARGNNFNGAIKAVLVDDCIIEKENEVDTLISGFREIQHRNPDIIYTKNGDSVLFPLLYHRAQLYAINTAIKLGRDFDYKDNGLQPVKDAKSYFSYGRMIYRPAFYILRGRIHIDISNSFLYGESGLRGLIDISRCSNIPLQLISRLGPGTAISQMQVNKAIEKRYLIPWKKNIPEHWKTGWELLTTDRGGLILEPAVGIHEDVVEMDYASLYPTIMLCHNISPETVLCSCCPDSPNQVPQLGYHICYKKKGIIPEVLKPILFRRFCFKARSRNKDYNKKIYEELQNAWKWILLVCFGYTGYRNARYGRIECHESITAFSRDILLTAMEIAEREGYEVLHGIIDSLWVKNKQQKVVPWRLARLISKKTGIRLEVKGRYRWIVFLPSKDTGMGALNRYYGLFDTGEVKVRGIELRQHNTPTFVRNVQRNMIEVLSRANDTEEFYDLIPDCIKIMCEHGRYLLNGDVAYDDLIITSRVSKNVSLYKVNTLVSAALLQLKDQGIFLEPGQVVRYVVKDENSSCYYKRVCIAENLSNNRDLDIDFYLRTIARCGESILIPFGYKKEYFEKMLYQLKLVKN
ncbi:MAG: hypothetical protein JXA91_01175 [Candidatus Thermoplasmatota archaeon]|nr:hypothetical protein [Candidatus Thermoplasmatota archaeon]